MRYVQFVFLREGTSDEPILDHLETLLVREGADEVVGEVRRYGGTVREKIEAFLDEQLPVDAIFVHRDADGAGFMARESEVFEAAGHFEECPPVIPVIPVSMTEAWLLVSESDIREVAGNPSGSMNLDLPPLHGVESVANAKARLKTAIGRASGLSGAELARLNKRFNANRATLLNRLNPDGAIRALPAWERLEEDVRRLIERSPRTTAG